MSEPANLPYVIRAEQRVAAPPAAVWAVLADFGNIHRWSPTVTASRLTSTATAGPGCSRACDIRGMGRIDETVTAWDEGRGFTYEATPLGPMGVARNRWTVAAAPGGSVVSVELSYGLRFGMVGARPACAGDAQEAGAADARGAGAARRPRRARPDRAGRVTLGPAARQTRMTTPVWTYAAPRPAAAHLAGWIGFWRGVEVDP